MNVVYRMYDSSGCLLYVGTSRRVIFRLAEHCKDKTWFREISDIKVEHFSTNEAAKENEIFAIQNEAPKYNIKHSDNKKPHQLKRLGDGTLCKDYIEDCDDPYRETSYEEVCPRALLNSPKDSYEWYRMRNNARVYKQKWERLLNDVEQMKENMNYLTNIDQDTLAIMDRYYEEKPKIKAQSVYGDALLKGCVNER